MPFLHTLFRLLQDLVFALTLSTILSLAAPAKVSAMLSFADTLPAVNGTIVTYNPFNNNNNNSNEDHVPEIFSYRVPETPIELRVTCTLPVDGRNLGDTLLRIHVYMDHQIALEGDQALGPSNDPFGWYVTGPDPQIGLNFTAQSIVPQNMTWGILEIAVEGLYMSLSRSGRNFGARFQIWDYERNVHWGRGRVGVFAADPVGQNVLAVASAGGTIKGGAVIGGANVPTS